jgi:hypothetical protein
MTTPAEELRTALLASDAVRALVKDRIRSDIGLEGDAYPLIVFKRSNFTVETGLDNSVHARSDTFAVECWADTRAKALDVADAVLEALLVADMPPDPSDPDAIDPEQDARCVPFNVTLWT